MAEIIKTQKSQIEGDAKKISMLQNKNSELHDDMQKAVDDVADAASKSIWVLAVVTFVCGVIIGLLF